MTQDRTTEVAVATERDYRLQVAARAKLMRKVRDFRQGQLADQAGVTRNYVSAVERGTIGLDAWRLGLLADTLGVPFGWLLCRSSAPVGISTLPKQELGGG